MATEYADVAQLSARLSPTGTTVGDVHDADITRAVYTASRLIDAHTGRNFHTGQNSTTRKVMADKATWNRSFGCWTVEIPDMSTVTTVSVDASDANSFTATTDYYTLPVNGWKYGRSGWPAETLVFPNLSMRCSGRYPLLSLTGVFGWAAVPYEVEETCIEVGKLVVQSRDTRGGLLSFGEAGLSRVRDAGMMSRIDVYRRMGGSGLPGIA